MDFTSFSKWMFERSSCSEPWLGGNVNEILETIQMMEPLHFKDLRNARSRRDTESKASISKVFC